MITAIAVQSDGNQSLGGITMDGCLVRTSPGGRIRAVGGLDGLVGWVCSRVTRPREEGDRVCLGRWGGMWGCLGFKK